MLIETLEDASITDSQPDWPKDAQPKQDKMSKDVIEKESRELKHHLRTLRQTLTPFEATLEKFEGQIEGTAGEMKRDSSEIKKDVQFEVEHFMAKMSRYSEQIVSSEVHAGDENMCCLLCCCPQTIISCILPKVETKAEEEAALRKKKYHGQIEAKDKEALQAAKASVQGMGLGANSATEIGEAALRTRKEGVRFLLPLGSEEAVQETSDKESEEAALRKQFWTGKGQVDSPKGFPSDLPSPGPSPRTLSSSPSVRRSPEAPRPPEGPLGCK